MSCRVMYQEPVPRVRQQRHWFRDGWQWKVSYDKWHDQACWVQCHARGWAKTEEAAATAALAWIGKFEERRRLDRWKNV